MRRTILQKLLNRLDGTNERTAGAIRDFETGVKTLREKLQQEISASTLEEVNLKINKLRKSIDLNPLIEGVSVLEQNFRTSVESLLNDIETKDKEVRAIVSSSDTSLTARAEELTEELEGLKLDLETLTQGSRTELNLLNNELGRLLETSKTFATRDELSKATLKGESEIKVISEQSIVNVKGLTKKVDDVRLELINRINERGGGNANRNIAVGGNTSVLSHFTDINLKPGSNVTITYAKNNTTKYTDITIAATGGSGTTRTIERTAVSSTIGAVAGTDYVVIATEGVKLDLPTAVSNTNLYTIKNVAASSVLLSPSGGQTIDSDPTLILGTQYTAVDLINDGNDNWSIT